jgi:dTDP-4-dehydrorhamnose 3,5-epimerase
MPAVGNERMRFREIAPFGAFIIEPEPASDKRGLFARLFDIDAFRAHGLPTEFRQASTSYNSHRSTLRGLHYQAAPHAEAKLVRCTAGAMFDVIVDAREGSPTFGQWRSFELTAHNRFTLFVPPGFAHGFETLADSTEVFYQMTVAHVGEAERGILWCDPDLAIAWPMPPAVISGRDRTLPHLRSDTPNEK